MTTAVLNALAGAPFSAALRARFDAAFAALSVAFENYGRALARAHRDYPVGL